jgi:hypothetical protein
MIFRRTLFFDIQINDGNVSDMQWYDAHKINGGNIILESLVVLMMILKEPRHLNTWIRSDDGSSAMLLLP